MNPPPPLPPHQKFLDPPVSLLWGRRHQFYFRVTLMVQNNGRFHTRRRTNRLNGQIVSDAQIVRCENGTNKFSDQRLCRLNLSVCLSVYEDDFLKTICPSKRTRRPKSDLNSHSDGLRRTNGRFNRLGGMELAKGAMVCGKFAWKLAALAILNSH